MVWQGQWESDAYVSGEIGYEKPAKRIDVLMIENSVSTDIQRALAAGWQAGYLNRNGKAKAFGCIEIRSLKELLKLL